MKKTTFLTVVFLLILFLGLPLFGANEPIRPYGNLYTFFGYRQAQTYDEGQNKERDRDTFYRINDNSNLGFNFKYEKYSGVFELGISDIEDERKVKIRKVYGQFDFGEGKLLIGQTWNPYVSFSNEMADYYRSKGFGSMYEDPTTQLMVEMDLGIYIDIIKPFVLSETYNTSQQVDNPETSSDATNIEYKIIDVEREITTRQPLENIEALAPKVALGYKFKNDMIDINAGGAAAAYKIKESDEVTFNKSWIISYIGYLNATVKVGDFVFSTSGGYLVNPANFGIYVASEGNTTYHGGAAPSIYNIATDKWEIKDTWSVQAFAETGYHITKDLLVHIGYGYSLVDYPLENTEKDMAMEYYANLKVNLGNLIALTPSISYRDYMKDMAGDEEGVEYFGGVLATVSFY